MSKDKEELKYRFGTGATLFVSSLARIVRGAGTGGGGDFGELIAVVCSLFVVAVVVVVVVCALFSGVDDDVVVFTAAVCCGAGVSVVGGAVVVVVGFSTGFLVPLGCCFAYFCYYRFILKITLT